jgi:hypothetical protein
VCQLHAAESRMREGDVTTGNALQVHTGPGGLVNAWDPFQLMDRLDEEALRRELDGIASTDLVYVVKDGGQEVTGLSKVGVDECCMMLVSQGQVIREEELDYQMLGESDDREALFKVKAARYAVSAQGQEVRMDQVIGVKRQPLYYEARPLDLDAKVPSKKYKGSTYRQLLEREDGRDYLEWMSENFGDADIRAFVGKILQGEVAEAKAGRKLNPHWYEHGAMKAARNARFRLIPANVRAAVIASANAAGQVRVVESPVGRTPHHAQPSQAHSQPQPTEAAGNESAANHHSGAYAPSEKQVEFFRKLAESPVFTEEERRRALEWLATKATRQTIKDQIDWLKNQVEKRKAPAHA